MGGGKAVSKHMAPTMNKRREEMQTHLATGIGAIANVNEVAKLWRINFLILGGNQERCDSNQLQLWSGDFFSLKVAVDEVDSQVKGLWDQLEFQMNLYKPVDKNRSHAFIDVWLRLHENWADRFVALNRAKVFVHVVDIFGSTEWIIGISLINIINLANVLVAKWIDASNYSRIAGLNNKLLAGLDWNGDI